MFIALGGEVSMGLTGGLSDMFFSFSDELIPNISFISYSNLALLSITVLGGSFKDSNS